MFFVDEAKIFIKAGQGGQGCESYYQDKYTRYPRPDGGDGGKGGDITFIADRSRHSLLDFKYRQHLEAQDGGHASSKGKRGGEGKTCVLKVPVGTMIRDHETGLLIKDLNADQQSIVVARGGKGGRGNAGGKIPLPPRKGEERTLDLELKLMADVGLIGFPNAGKSTLISNLSKAKSKVASYPFTTRGPILGIVSDDDFEFIVADLPGIIEGAHKGKGLGDRFLRHAQRTKILVHLLDMAGTEGRDPLEDYEKLNYELEQYSDSFASKYKFVVANKMDLAESTDNLKRFKQKYKEKIFAISALEKKGFKKLISAIRKILCVENSPE